MSAKTRPAVARSLSFAKFVAFVPFAASLPVATGGCSMSYVPAEGPRASLAIDEGKPVIVKNGTRTPIGAFGSGLEEALADDPEAAEKASDFHTRSVAGFIQVLGGAVALVAGATLAGSQACFSSSCGDQSSAATGAGLGLMAGGLALYAAGFITTLSAQPRLYDAINIYNDRVEHRRGTIEESRSRSIPSAAPLLVVPPERTF